MGYLFVILSSLLFGTLPSIQNIAIINGASAFDVLLICNGVSLLGSLILCLINRVNLSLNPKEIFVYLVTGSLGLFLTDLFLNLAYTRIPVGMTTVIHFTYPTLVCVEATLFFRSRFTFSELLAIVLSVSGLILLTDSKMSLDFLGIVFAFLSALAYSFNLTMADHSVMKDHNVYKKNFYIYLVSMMFSIIFNTNEGFIPHVEFNQFIYLFIAGVMLMTGSILLTKGIIILGSSDAAFISTLEPIVSLIVSTILYKYQFTFRIILGCILIVLSLLPIVFTKTD